MEVITHFTTFPLVKLAVEYDALFNPTTGALSTDHWYEGVVPKLVPDAVKVNEAPAHDGFEPDVKAIEDVGVNEETNDIVIAFEVAVVVLAQVELDVSTHVTICPFVRAAELYVEVFPPTFCEPTIH